VIDNGGLTRAVAVRLCLAAVLALVLAAALAVGVGFAVDATVPNSCAGDSCMGTPGLVAGGLSTPVTTYIGWAVALLAVRIRRPWLLALAAAPLTLFLLAACAGLLLNGALNRTGEVEAWALVAVGLLTAGPGVGLAAGVTVLGTGWKRVATIPAAVVLVILAGVLVVKVVTPIREAATVTKYVPQTYRYVDPALTLQVLTLNSYSQSLELDYFAADHGERTVTVTEYRAPGGYLRTVASATCPPATPDSAACLRVPSTAPTLGLWRSGQDSRSQVVVLRADALLVVDISDVPTEQVALDVAARLRPDSAFSVISSAHATSIYDGGTHQP